MHVDEAPLAAEVATPWQEEEEPLPFESSTTSPFEREGESDSEPAPEEPADVFAPVAETPFPSADEPSEQEPTDFTDTLTMADLYARQGLIADARHIYENILHRDPMNEDVAMKLRALPSQSDVAAPAPEPELPADDDESPFEPQPLAAVPPPLAAVPPPPIPFTPRATTGDSSKQAKIARLEQWLAKVARGESRV